MKAPPASRPANPYEEHRGETKATTRKVRVFTAAVFAISSAFMVSMLLHFGQNLASSLAVGFLIGATAAIEVGWFGGRAFFGEDV